MACVPEDMCKINEELQAVVQELFTEFVKPSTVLGQFRIILERQEHEKVEKVVRNEGDIYGAHHLLSILYQKDGWFSSLLEILCHRNVRLQHVSDMIVEEKKILEHLQSVSAEEKAQIRAAVLGKSVSSLYIDYNNDLEGRIHEIFVELVDPQKVLHVFHKYSDKILTRNDIEHVCAEMNIHGSYAGNCLLLKRLILYENWFDVLLQVLRDPEIKLDHAANMMENVTADTRVALANIQQIYVQYTSESMVTDSAEMRHDSEELSSHDHQNADNTKSKSDIQLPVKTKDAIEMGDSNGNNELIDAAARGNIKLLMSLFLQGSDMNTSDENERTALMYAAFEGQVTCIKLLLICGCDVNKQDCNGNTALMIACSEGHIECVRVLINEYADVDVVNKHGATALVLTAMKGYVDCMRFLLEGKCDPNILHNRGLTALMYAARFGHSECVKLLTDWHCDVNMCNYKGQTALMYAAEHGHHMCMELLIDGGADVDKSDDERNTAIMFAVLHQHTECIQLLINKHCNLKISNIFRYTPLMLAERKNYIECVRLLSQEQSADDFQNIN